MSCEITCSICGAKVSDKWEHIKPPTEEEIKKRFPEYTSEITKEGILYAPYIPLIVASATKFNKGINMGNERKESIPFVKEMEELHHAVMFEKLTYQQREKLCIYIEAMTNIDTPGRVNQFEELCSVHFD